jgi:hypothetical protein
MSIGNLKDQGNKSNNFPYQLSVLKLLSSINSGISAIPGVDYETRTTMYQAIANGPGYSIGDIIVRYDIIDVATSTVVSTIWFNQTTQAVIVAPAPANITPIAAPSSVTIINPPGNPVNVTLPTGVSRTPSTLLVPASTALTSTTAGQKQVSMKVSGSNATIGGVAIPNGTVLTYSAELNDTVGSISYSTGAGTTILISYLT